MTPAEVATATGMQGLNVRQLLFKMAKAGEIYKAGKSRYWLEPSTPGNSDNAGNAKTHTIDAAAEFPDEPVTGFNETDNGPITDVVDGPVTILDVTDNAADNAVTSRRHKCWHCEERGETLQVIHGIAKPRLHRECIDAWVAEYEERLA